MWDEIKQGMLFERGAMSNWKSALMQDYARNTNNAKWSWIRLFRVARRIPGLQYMMWHRFTTGSQNCPVSLMHRFCIKVLQNRGYKYGFDIPHDTIMGVLFAILEW